MLIGKNQSTSLDVRILATAAKTLSELELLLESPLLLDIDFVNEHSANIRSFGQQLRKRAQELLLVALTERNQANVAASLQVNEETIQRLIAFNCISPPPPFFFADFGRSFSICNLCPKSSFSPSIQP